MAIVSNQVKAGAVTDYREAAYTGSSLASANYSVQVTHVASESVSVINLLVRMSGTTSSRNGYIGQFNRTAGQYKIIRIDSGAETTIASGAIGTLNASDALYFEINGSAMALKHAGSTVLSQSDATYSSAGTPGIGIYADTNSVIIDDFTASDLATSGGRLIGGSLVGGNLIGVLA